LQPPTTLERCTNRARGFANASSDAITPLSEIEAHYNNSAQHANSLLLPQSLADLKGTLTEKFPWFFKTGVAVKFDLQGQNWEWDTYKADQIIAQGSFENGVLTLLPHELSLTTLVALNAQVGGTQQSVSCG